MVRAEASWGGWQGASETHVRSDLERASNAARRLKLLPARRVAPLFALSGVAPQSQTHQRVCSFVAPCSDQKSAATRAILVFQQSPRRNYASRRQLLLLKLLGSPAPSDERAAPVK